MAVALILRRGTGIQAFSGLSNLIKNNNVVLANARCFSHLTQNNNKNVAATNNKMHLAIVNSTLSKRNMSGDHSKLWPIEKAVSISMLVLTPATFLCPNMVLDNLFAVATVMHFHWGLEACVVDYVRPILFGAAIPKLTMALLYLISVSTLGGLLYYNYNDIGIGKTVRKIWEIKE